jgi:hypothetical protein
MLRLDREALLEKDELRIFSDCGLLLYDLDARVFVFFRYHCRTRNPVVFANCCDLRHELGGHAPHFGRACFTRRHFDSPESQPIENAHMSKEKDTVLQVCLFHLVLLEDESL